MKLKSFQDAIEFQDVHFSYEKESQTQEIAGSELHEALRGVSLTVTARRGGGAGGAERSGEVDADESAAAVLSM